MRGGIHKKGNNYYAVVYDGIDPGTGRKRRRWVPAGTRRADAERVLADLIRRKYDGEPVPAERLTVAQYLTERWLPVQKSRLRASTYDSYRRNIDLHVVPALGRRPLAKVTPEDLDLFYATLLTEGRKKAGGRSRGLAPKTVRNIHLMLSKALADAARKGLVARNIASLADAPSAQASRKGEIKAWDAQQLATFLDARTVSTLRFTLPPTRGCAAARSSGFGGETSTSMQDGSRCARHSSRSPTRSISPT